MDFSFSSIIWLFFIFAMLGPMIQQAKLNQKRYQLTRQFERKRGSRLITLIHRQESLSILGIPLSKFINIEDSEQVLRAIRLTPPDMPIDIILHTPGGLVLASEQIARALENHPAKVTAFVPHYAMSGGTMIALSADEIVMDSNAVLGPVDPQIGQYPAASILETVRLKGTAKVDDNTLILADMSSKAIAQVKDFITYLLTDNLGEEKALEISEIFSSGRWTHDYPINFEFLSKLGLPVSRELPAEVFAIMDQYPQPAQRRPSVQYIPLPYGGKEEK
ncbi:SDH family Clp fold serine proteinase [Desulforamulus ruminis]|uniref:Periplasmic serine protease n=1 Tax=Desulforamulus ruminis (strain ATCC 23193 / DSM 2154 / NCIMB 8452 / DL) TaxID=696281 RepID=F6DNZ3_DESRL|nr:hypothetical protein [Desulforamulus ruminis]AEG60712.1 periplasmic serine protease [Desulforamulus ruminis DSM 2154]